MPAKNTKIPTTLDALLEGVSAQRAIPEKKFQAILDFYNKRSDDKETALSGVKLYWWRTFPRTDAKKTNRRHTNVGVLDCVQSQEGGAIEITELPSDFRAYTTEILGGGRYRIILSDKARENSQVALATLKIDHLEHSPILDPRELDDTDPETMAWITRQLSLGALVRVGAGEYALNNDTSKPSQSQTHDQQGMAAVAMEAIKSRDNPVTEHAMKKSIDLVADTAERLIEKSKEGEGGMTNTLIALANVLKPGDSGITAMVPLLITMITENNKAQMQMFQLLLARDRAPAPSADEQSTGVDVVERLLSLATKINGKDKPSLWDQVREFVPMLLPLFLARAGGGAGNMAAMLPQFMHGMGAPAPAAEPAAPAGPLTPQQIHDLAGHAWRAMQRKQDGSDFAAAVDTWISPEMYNSLRAMGKQQLMATLLSSGFGAQFQPLTPELDTFLEEFIAYGDNVEPGAGAQPAPPPGGTPPGTPPAQPPAADARPLGAV